VLSGSDRLAIAVGVASLVAGVLVLALAHGWVAVIVGACLLGLAGIALVSLVFLVIGEGEERDRGEEPR
jgi:MFS family permease